MPHQDYDRENWEDRDNEQHRDNEQRRRRETWRSERNWAGEGGWENRPGSRSGYGGRQGRYQDDQGRNFGRGNYGYEGHFETPRYGEYGQESGRMNRYDPDLGGSYNRQPGMHGQDFDWDRSQRQGQGRYGSNLERGYDQGRMGADWSRGPGRYAQDWGRDNYQGQGRRQPDWERGQSQGHYYDPGMNYGQDWDTGYDYEYEDSPTWMYTEMWWIPGPMTGLGPRGYQRSDERICEDVCDRLTRHGRIDASDIEVEVEDGEVTISGTVNTQEEKRIAEDAIVSISGVMDIHNRLHRTRPSYDLGEGRGQIRKDMEVVGKDDERIGTVKKIRSQDFLVKRDMARDVYIPFNACQEADQNIKLGISADEIDQQGWEYPEIVETPQLRGSEGSRNG